MKKITLGKKKLILLISLVLIATVAVGGTLAYLVDMTGDVENSFTPAEVTCEVTETMKDNVKTNVQVKNTGDTDAYIRAAIVVTWQKSDGDDKGAVYGESPKTEDYMLDVNTTEWFEGTDGYFYHKSPVAVNEKTAVLINAAKPLKAGPAGYTLHIEVIADAVQSEPTDAVMQAWGIGSIDSEGNIVKLSGSGGE